MPRFTGFASRALMIMLLLLCAPALAQTLQWTQLQISGRGGSATAYDSARGITVLFGGSPGHANNETWEWNGTTWNQMVVSGPAARTSHAMTYDSARNVVVLFGGRNDTGSQEIYRDTWEWNGTTWALRSSTGPSMRYGASLAYDTVRGVSVLFGGRLNNTDSNETWEWNGATWTQRIVTGPSARSSHAMAYDSARGVTVLFGGQFNSDPFSDTWEWNGTVWTRRTVPSPAARSDHSMAFDSVRNVTVMFGGWVSGAGGPSDETWEWNGTSWSQRFLTGPLRRTGHAMVFDSSRGVCLLFGGYARTVPGGNSSVQNETWQYNGTAWAQVYSSFPGTGSPAAAYDERRAVTVLFGGTNPVTGRYNDRTFEWNGFSWTQRSISAPLARGQHGMCFDSVRGVTVLFGGYNDHIIFEDTWEYGVELGWSRRATSGPPPHVGPSLAFDKRRGVSVLFSPSSSNGPLGETWEWNGSIWTLNPNTGPSSRGGHAIAYDSGRGVIVLFGGYGTSRLGDTWEFNGSTWIQRSSSGPSPRDGHRMVYDSARGVTVLFGGYDGSAPYGVDGTWEWDGTNWTLLPVTGPIGRYSHAMSYHAALQTTMVMAGVISGGETWGLAPSCISPFITLHPVANSVCVGDSISLSAAAIGTGPFMFQWRKDGIAIDPVLNPSAATPSFTISNFLAADSGLYDASISNACDVAITRAVFLLICPANFNCDNAVDFFDYLDFVSAFAALNSEADFNRDGVVDQADYLDFVQAFASNCVN